MFPGGISRCSPWRARALIGVVPWGESLLPVLHESALGGEADARARLVVVETSRGPIGVPAASIESLAGSTEGCRALDPETIGRIAGEST